MVLTIINGRAAIADEISSLGQCYARGTAAIQIHVSASKLQFVQNLGTHPEREFYMLKAGMATSLKGI